MGIFTDENGVVHFEITKGANDLAYETNTQDIDGDYIMSSYNQTGSGFNFDSSYIDGYSSVVPPSPVSKTNNANNLLEAVKLSGNNVSEGIKELTESVNSVTKSIERSVKSIDNMAVNLKSVLSSLGIQISVGNNIKQLDTKLKNYHNEHQTAKAIKELEKLDFEMNGSPDLKDSEGIQIKPQHAEALKNAEIGKEAFKGNQVDYEELLEGINGLGENDTDTDSEDDIMSNVLKLLVDNIDVTKIDNNGKE